MTEATQYGAVFKELRTNRQFSLKQAASDTVSVSQLSKFERGDSDLSLTKFISALDAIGVGLGEFMDKVNDYKRVEQARVMAALAKLFYDKDLEALEQLACEQDEKAQQDHTNPRHRLNAIMIRGGICELDPEHHSMNQDDLDFVSDYLFQTEDWGMDEVILNGNLSQFYPTELNCMRARQIVGNKSFFAENSRNRRIVEATILNLIILCTERGEYDVVPEFDHIAQELIQVTERDTYHRMIYLYTKGFYLYKTGNPSGKDDMLFAIECFKRLNCDGHVLYYQTHFNKHMP